MNDFFDLLLALGSFLGIIAFLQMQSLKKQLQALQNKLQVQQQSDNPSRKPPRQTPVTPASSPVTTLNDSDVRSVNSIEPKRQFDNPEALNSENSITQKGWFAQQNWMVWLGGFCVALAGIFMARYAMEQGLLGPGARIALGLILGLTLHGVAITLRLKTQQHPAVAALAGGSSIILFAVLLAALHSYQMWRPGTVFVLLALVGIATTWLALIHGPMLAAIGMIGAYAVPLLVSTGSGNTLAAMGYALVISASVLFLLRSVYRAWLWWGLMSGGLLWWGLSFVNHNAEDWRALYLAVFAYGLLAIPTKDWLLNKVNQTPIRSLQLHNLDGCLPVGLLIVSLAHGITLAAEEWHAGFVHWLWLPLTILWVAGRQSFYIPIAWVLMLGQLLGLLLARLEFSGNGFSISEVTLEQRNGYFQFLALMTVLFCGMALLNLRRAMAGITWAAMLVLTPVLGLALAYLMAQPAYTNIHWALCVFTLGAIYIACATLGQKRHWSAGTIAWMFLGGHFAYGIAAAFLLEQASLTLALALQIISLAWTQQKFQLPVLHWILKAVTTIVVVRLTLNPWLLDYQTTSHWTLWTYGGSFCCCLLGMRWLRDYPDQRQWLEGAALHLFVLTLWSEIRYWLYNGHVFAEQVTFIECSIYASLPAALALVYYFRASTSTHLRPLYLLYSWVLVGFALINYGAIVLATLISLPWAWQSISTTPIFNILLLAFGGPLLVSVLLERYYDSRWRFASLLFVALSAFAFISIEIRHLWTGFIRLDTGWQNAELYTYSVVWLAISVAALLGGSWRWGDHCYRGGMVLLGVVIVKIFMIDMHDLAGLLRIASFLGLGLALLGVAFLHKKLQNKSFDG